MGVLSQVSFPFPSVPFDRGPARRRVSIEISFGDSMAINLDWTPTIKEHGSKQSQELLFDRGRAGIRGALSSFRLEASRETARERPRVLSPWLLCSASIMPAEFDF